MPSTRSKAEILLVVVTFFWGATFVVVKQALTDASPLSFIAARFVLAGGLLFLIFGRKRPDWRALPASIVLGVLLFLGYVFQTWGQEYTTPSKCAFITAFSVILVPVILAVMGAPLSRASVAGALLGLAGIYLLVAPSGLNSINEGDVLTLLGAVAFAVYIVLLARYSREHSYRDLAPPQILLVGLLACAGLPFSGARRFHWSAYLGIAIVLTAIFSTALAFAVQNWAQRFVPAAHTALIFALEPVFAALTSIIVMNERFGKRVIFGSALILVGMFLSEICGRLESEASSP